MPALFCDARRDTTSLKATDLDLLRLSIANYVPVLSSERSLATDCITSDAPRRELSSSLLRCVASPRPHSCHLQNAPFLTVTARGPPLAKSCLIADARTSSSVLNLLHLTGYYRAILDGLDWYLPDPQHLSSTLMTKAKDESPEQRQSRLDRSAERCAQLHALGYSLSQMAFGLSALLHRRCAEVSSAEAPTRHHQHLPQVESLGRCDAFPLADLLLPSEKKVGSAFGTELGFERRRGQGVAPWDAPQAPSRAGQSPLARALGYVHALLSETSSKIATETTRIEELMPSSKAAGWPTVIKPRGDANLELVDVRKMRHELRSVLATTTASKDSSAATYGGSVSPGLVDCVSEINSAQELNYAALHVLEACRKLVVLLCTELSVQVDRRVVPRLALLLEILPLLAPTGPKVDQNAGYRAEKVQAQKEPKPCNVALAPVLAKCSLLLLHCVGDYWRAQSHSQLNIILTSCLTALLPPAVLPSAARTALYMVLLSLLTPHKGSHGTPVSALVAKKGLALINLLVFDACEDSPAGQASAIALLGMILSFQPSGSSWTMELLLSGAVRHLAEPLALQSPLSDPWLSALKPMARGGSRRATHFYASLVALLTQTVYFMVAQSACDGRGREQSAQALLTSDVLMHLSTAAFLDVTPEGAGAERPSSASREYLHDRLMLPTLRLISAACIVHRSNDDAIVSLLNSFLLRSNERVSSVSSMLRVLPSPSRHRKRRRGELASGDSRLSSSENLLACELLSHQVLMLLRLARSTRSDAEHITTSVRIYVIGVVHAIPSLAAMLPKVSKLHVTRFSEVVFEAVAKRSDASRMVDQSVQQGGMMGADADRPLDSKLVAADTIVHLVCVHSRRYDVARVDEAVWKDLAHVVSDIDTMAAEIATVRALSKAMALIAQDSTSCIASLNAALITALVDWTLDFLKTVIHARETCAEMLLAAARSTMRDYEAVAVELLEHALVVLDCTLKGAHEKRTASGLKLLTDRVPVLGSNDPGLTIVNVLQKVRFPIHPRKAYEIPHPRTPHLYLPQGARAHCYIRLGAGGGDIAYASR